MCVNGVKGLPGGAQSVWIECGPDFVGIASYPEPNCAAAPEITTPIYSMRTNECHAYGLTFYEYASYQCVGNASVITQLFYSTPSCQTSLPIPPSRVPVGKCLQGQRSSTGLFSYSTSCVDGISTTSFWEGTNCSGAPAVMRSGRINSCFPSYAETNTYTRFLCPSGPDSLMCAALGPFILWIWWPLLAAIVITGLFGGTYLAVAVLLYKYRKKRYLTHRGKQSEKDDDPESVALAAMDITDEIIKLRKLFGPRISTVSAYSSQSPRGGAILTAMCITNSLVFMGLLANHIAIEKKVGYAAFEYGGVADWFAFAGYFSLMFTGLVPTVPPKPLDPSHKYNPNVIVMWMALDTSRSCCLYFVVKFFHNFGVGLFMVCSIVAGFLRSPNTFEYVLLYSSSAFVLIFNFLQSVLEGRMRFLTHAKAFLERTQSALEKSLGGSLRGSMGTPPPQVQPVEEPLNGEPLAKLHCLFIRGAGLYNGRDVGLWYGGLAHFPLCQQRLGDVLFHDWHRVLGTTCCLCARYCKDNTTG